MSKCTIDRDRNHIYTNSNKELHREDGPAVIYSNGIKNWYYHGKLIECNSQKEFLKIIKMKAFW